MRPAEAKGRHVLYVGASPDPVRVAAQRVEASFDTVGHPEDALAWLGSHPRGLVLMHSPQSAAWLPMFRSNAPLCRFVLLAHPPRSTDELTHPWRVAEGVLEAPLGEWFDALPEILPPSAAREDPAYPARSWMLLTLDAEALLTRAYGWTAFTGQSEPEARGLGWLAMLEDPEGWRQLMDQDSNHLRGEMAVYNQLAQRYHVCLFRCVRNVGWTVHIEDREREVQRNGRVEALEAQVERGQLEIEGLRATVARLDQQLREHARARESLSEELVEAYQAFADGLRTLKDKVQPASWIEAQLRLADFATRPLDRRPVRLTEVLAHALRQAGVQTAVKVLEAANEEVEVMVDAPLVRDSLVILLCALTKPRLALSDDKGHLYIAIRDPCPIEPWSRVLPLRVVVRRHGELLGWSAPSDEDPLHTVWFSLPTLR